MAKNNKKCIICGKEYSYCPTCASSRTMPTWMVVFDKDRCNELYKICTSVRDGKIDKMEARKRLEVLDLSDLETLHEVTKERVKEIMKENIVSKVDIDATESKDVETVQENNIVKTEIDDVAEQNTVKKYQNKKYKTKQITEILEK